MHLVGHVTRRGTTGPCDPVSPDGASGQLLTNNEALLSGVAGGRTPIVGSAGLARAKC